MTTLDWINGGVNLINGGINAYGQVEAIKRANKVQKAPNVINRQPVNVTQIIDEETKQAMIQKQKAERDTYLLMQSSMFSKLLDKERNKFKSDNTIIYISAGVCLLGLMFVTINNKNKTIKNG